MHAEVRGYLAYPGNDFGWSHWSDAREALAGFDQLREDAVGGSHKALQSLSLLFAPTGSLQEVASSTGWGDAFLRLAARFDEAASGS